MTDYDVIVIGAGIVGAAAAYELSKAARVLLLERERTPGVHSTGRSASMLIDGYGGPDLAAFVRASRVFMDEPPPEWSDPLLRARGRLMVADDASQALLDDYEARIRPLAPQLERLDCHAVRRLAPPLRPDCAWQGLWDPEAHEIDVHALHQGFLAGLAKRNGRLLIQADVRRLERVGGHWQVDWGDAVASATVVVNAAGAWARQVGDLAGASAFAIAPLQRTIVHFDAEAGDDPALWPQVVDAAQQWYFKPESGGVLVSPMDETPVEPRDAQPEELDVAIAVDRFEQVTGRTVARLRGRWAGLRTFTADRLPVIGHDPQAKDFFWLAALGGAGVMVAPAVGQAAAVAISGGKASETHPGAASAVLSPARFVR